MMEKIGLCHNDGKPIIGRIEHDEAVLKINKIVEWINKHEKEHDCIGRIRGRRSRGEE